MQYRSWLVREWRSPNAEPRIEIEDIQAGVRISLSSLQAAAHWMERDAEGHDLRLGPPSEHRERVPR